MLLCDWLQANGLVVQDLYSGRPIVSSETRLTDISKHITARVKPLIRYLYLLKFTYFKQVTVYEARVSKTRALSTK